MTNTDEQNQLLEVNSNVYTLKNGHISTIDVNNVAHLRNALVRNGSLLNVDFVDARKE